ncbi:MAG: prepilin-type N-terminal cleavage/methylation domain-containing protein [Armatimonadetes bacterium]|nr:prepilin-type N-terminal cleavage/methylation domain-containing protein [Armatimonadota bacterium]
MATRRGFTLIELLVVIAIIAILAAILFPVFAKAREKARQSSCLSNVKQLTLGVLQYVQDYDEKMPDTPGWECGLAQDATTRWYELVQPYTKNKQIAECPSTTWEAGWTKLPSWAGQIVNYGQGWWANCSNAAPYEKSGYSLAAYNTPASSIAICDSAHNGDGASRWEKVAFSTVCGAGCNPALQTDDYTRHNGGSNIGFVDGHAKWNRATSIGGRWGTDIKNGP